MLFYFYADPFKKALNPTIPASFFYFNTVISEGGFDIIPFEEIQVVIGFGPSLQVESPNQN